MAHKRARRKTIPPALEGMVRQYIKTALWSTTDNADDSGGKPLDRNYGLEHVSVAFHNEAVTTCADFIALCEEKGLYEALGNDLGKAGFMLWLTQNHHGAGFWDGDYVRGDELTAVAHTFGSVDLYVWRGRVTC